MAINSPHKSSALRCLPRMPAAGDQRRAHRRPVQSNSPTFLIFRSSIICRHPLSSSGRKYSLHLPISSYTVYFISHLTLTNSFTAAVVGLMRYAPAVMLAGQARIFACSAKPLLQLRCAMLAGQARIFARWPKPLLRLVHSHHYGSAVYTLCLNSSHLMRYAPRLPAPGTWSRARTAGFTALSRR